MAKQVIAAGVLDGQVIGAVTFRDITTSRGPGRVFEIPFSDGRKYETFKTDVANKAHPFAGQSCSIRYEHSKNGDFDNYTLLDIGPVGSFGQATNQAATPAPFVGAQSGVAPQQFTPAELIAGVHLAPINIQADNTKQAEREGRIMRGNALNAVGSLLGPLVADGQYHDVDGCLDPGSLSGAVVALCEAFVTYIATGQGQTVAPAAVEVGAPVSTAQGNAIPF